MKKKTKLLIRDSFFSTILTSIIILLLSITFVNIKFFNPIVEALEDFDFLDIYYAENFGNSDLVNTDIILVNIHDNSRETRENMLGFCCSYWSRKIIYVKTKKSSNFLELFGFMLTV